MWKRWILVPLPALPLPHFRFHKNVVILLVAIPPTNVEVADSAYRFRFRIPGYNAQIYCIHFPEIVYQFEGIGWSLSTCDLGCEWEIPWILQDLVPTFLMQWTPSLLENALVIPVSKRLFCVKGFDWLLSYIPLSNGQENNEYLWMFLPMQFDSLINIFLFCISFHFIMSS